MSTFRAISETALDAIRNAFNAALSLAEGFRDEAGDSASDAQLQAQSTDPFTDSTGAQFDKGARGYLDDTQQAAQEIVDKIDFDGAQEGDLFRVNEQGIAVPVRANDKTIYRTAPLNSYFSTKDIIAWDNADKDLTNGTPLTTLDSGQSWESFIGDPIAYSISGGGAFRGAGSIVDGFSSVFSWQRTSAGIEWRVRRSTFGVRSGIILFAKDTSNFVIFEKFMFSDFTGGLSTQNNDYRLVSVVDGVGTSLGSISNSSIYGGGSNDGMDSTNIEWVIKWKFRGRNDNSRLLIFLRQDPSVRLEIDITSLNATYPTTSDLAFIGICGDSQINSLTTRIIASRI